MSRRLEMAIVVKDMERDWNILHKLYPHILNILDMPRFDVVLQALEAASDDDCIFGSPVLIKFQTCCAHYLAAYTKVEHTLRRNRGKKGTPGETC